MIPKGVQSHSDTDFSDNSSYSDSGSNSGDEFRSHRGRRRPMRGRGRSWNNYGPPMFPPYSYPPPYGPSYGQWDPVYGPPMFPQVQQPFLGHGRNRSRGRGETMHNHRCSGQIDQTKRRTEERRVGKELKL